MVNGARPPVPLIPVLAVAWIAALTAVVRTGTQQPQQHRPAHSKATFETSDTCVACHDGLTSASGEPVSFGADWRGSIMANSSRDPYWQASVRRETLDHPSAAAAIEDECAICHMPMATAGARAKGGRGRVFDHLPIGSRTTAEDRLAHDGVSCTACHQISPRQPRYA